MGDLCTFPSFHLMPSASARDASTFAWDKSYGMKSTSVTLASLFSLLAVIFVFSVQHAISRTLSLEERLYNRARWTDTGRIKLENSLWDPKAHTLFDLYIYFNSMIKQGILSFINW